MPNKKFKRWSKEDDAKLVAACEKLTTIPRNGLPGLTKNAWAEVAEQFPGRGLRSCMHHYWDLRAFAGQKRKYRPRGTPAGPKSEFRQLPLTTFALPKTITAYVFGDPLPGRSALDRRRQGQSA